VSAVITVTHAHIGAIPAVLKKYTTVKSEKYTNTGCEYTVTMIPGEYDKLLNELNNSTKGEYDIVIEGGADPLATAVDTGKGRGRGKATTGGDGDTGKGRGRGSKKN